MRRSSVPTGSTGCWHAQYSHPPLEQPHWSTRVGVGWGGRGGEGITLMHTQPQHDLHHSTPHLCLHSEVVLCSTRYLSRQLVGCLCDGTFIRIYVRTYVCMYVCTYVHMHSAVQQTESQFSTHTLFASFTATYVNSYEGCKWTIHGPTLLHVHTTPLGCYSPPQAVRLAWLARPSCTKYPPITT